MISIKYRNILITNIRKKDINQKFVRSLNDNRLNKYLSTQKKKQKIKDALRYYNFMKKNRYHYLKVFNKKTHEIIGTITFRPLSDQSFSLGFMLCSIKYLGSELFFQAVKNSMKYMFKNMRIKNILAATNKTNIQSTFFLIKLGFKLIGKSHYSFDFVKFR